jgi:hypothetical protein
VQNLKLQILTFDSRTHQLEVLDNENGPGTGASSARQAAATRAALAAINGGFFTPEGTPLGLVVEGGRRYGTLSNSSLGSGFYLLPSNQQASRIIRRTDWSTATSGQSPNHALQSGPFLLENGQPVAGLSTSRPRPRSFLLWDGFHGWALAHSTSTTLAQLSKALATQPVPGFAIHHALNLDGGSSCDLWVSSSVKGGPVSIRPLWAKDVRNYLILTPRLP